jgi:hypothetical protein
MRKSFIGLILGVRTKSPKGGVLPAPKNIAVSAALICLALAIAKAFIPQEPQFGAVLLLLGGAVLAGFAAFRFRGEEPHVRIKRP